MFDINAQERLQYYVYALFDSGNPNLPFYVGKGYGNRVFAHAMGEQVTQATDQVISMKNELIAEIKNNGRKIIHKIIRFGLSEEEALNIEASLIDLVNYICPDTLKNEISGQGVSEGIIDADDLAFSLSAQEMESDIPILVIKIERRWSELLMQFGSAVNIPVDEIFKVTKGDWKINIDRVQRAECILAVARGLVRAVFVPNGWSDAGYENRKFMTGLLDNSRFNHFVGTSVAHLFSRGSQNPIRYLQC